MKMVQAIIQPQRLEAVLAALEKVAVERMTVLDGIGFGRRAEFADPSQSPGPLVLEYQPRRLVRNIVLEIVVNDDFADRTVAAVQAAARTGENGRLGDGKIWIASVEQTVQIGGTETGPGAV